MHITVILSVACALQRKEVNTSFFFRGTFCTLWFLIDLSFRVAAKFPSFYSKRWKHHLCVIFCKLCEGNAYSKPEIVTSAWTHSIRSPTFRQDFPFTACFWTFCVLGFPVTGCSSGSRCCIYSAMHVAHAPSLIQKNAEEILHLKIDFKSCRSILSSKSFTGDLGPI